MMRSLRLSLILVVFCGLAAGAGSRQETAALGVALSTFGSAQIAGPLELDLAISPAVGSPGEVLELVVKLTNHAFVTSAPEVLLQLPDKVSLASMGALPAGVTANLQVNVLSWLPILPANGGTQQFSLQLRVETVDVGQPEEQITVILKNDSTEQSVSAGFWLGVPPQIDAILNPPQAAVGQPIQFGAKTSGSGPVSQVWLLGDGRRVEVENPVVVYPAPGVYQVTLEATNPLTTVRQTRAINIVPHPAAQFSPDDSTPGVGQVVTFHNQSGGQPPLAVHWDFGDGTTASAAQPTHQYDAPGTYQVHLVVENSFGQSEAYWPVTVGQPPTADMVIAEEVAAGQPIIGQAFGDETVTMFQWDMGDGRVYEGAEISHVYRQMGDYYIAMTAKNNYGGIDVGRWIHVTAGVLNLYLPAIIQADLSLSNFVIAGNVDDSAGSMGITLAPVELDEPFVLEPDPSAAGKSPAEQLLHYVNEARRRFDLPALTPVPELSAAAQAHSLEMTVTDQPHAGADGSFPPERLLLHGYQGGYAGEASAWGFEHAHLAVEYWINSPDHRRILLNPYANEIGVGHVTDFRAANLWYWTAEFGNSHGAPIQPTFRLQRPEVDAEALLGDAVTYSWNWPAPLQPGQQFVVYLAANGKTTRLGSVTQPQVGSYYVLEAAASDVGVDDGLYEWQVKLEDDVRNSLAESERRSIKLLPDPSLPTPSATPTMTPTPTATATTTPTPTLPWPTTTPLPPPPTQPPLITATPDQ
ncbi:MAG TPA: PKD domain-containing protein [Anaerolineae bacterium]